MVTFKQLEEHLDGVERRGNPHLESLEEAGRGSDTVAELWFDGPVESDFPVIADSEIESIQAPHVLLVPSLSDQLSSLLELFVETPDQWGISDNADIHDSFSHGDSVFVGPYTSIGPDVTVGDQVRIEAGVTIDGNVTLGDDVHLHSGVRFESPAEVGSGTIIHANTVIGTDGYGYEQTDHGHEKIPQIGRVEIGENVEIGAGVAIDRATFGATRIGSGSKLDNHVHVAHNCELGENCLMVAKSGLAGSVTLGDNVILAGKAAVEDHNTIADDVIVAAKAGVTKDVEDAGSVVSGFPARPHQEELKIKAVRRKLPSLRKRLIELENAVNDIEQGENTNGEN
ncbi:MAG: UDP-3-O-(3-hydroxymyristoyl)glucosamine N-acyltransferase [bacterium]